MSKPLLALTYDDGPTKHTPRVLDALEKYGINATFFVEGRYIKGNEDILKRSYKMGNEILPHAWNHPDLRQLTSDAIKKQILDTAELINETLGLGDKPINLYRPPYGYFDNAVLKASEEIDYSLINWSIDTLDWENKNPDIIFERTMKWLHDGAIILCHDAFDSTGEATERIIPVLMEKYQFVTISELLSGLTIKPGRLYDNGSDEIRLEWHRY